MSGGADTVGEEQGGHVEHTTNALPATSAGELEGLVRKRLAGRVGPELAGTIPAADKFYDLGIDSLDVVSVLAELERDCAVDRIADGELWDIADSVNALVGYLAAHGRGGGRT